MTNDRGPDSTPESPDDSPDAEFDRIVSGLEFDLSDLGDLDEAAEEAAEAEPLAPPEIDDEPPPEFEEVTYRLAPPVRSATNPWRRRAWFFVVLIPVVILLAQIFNIYISRNFGVLVAIVFAGVLAWLLLTTNEGRGVPPGSDDGTSL